MRNVSSARPFERERLQAKLDRYGKYDPATKPRPSAYTPSVHLYNNTVVRKAFAKLVPAALVMYMVGLVIRVSNGEVGLIMYLCGGSMALVMLPALSEAVKCVRFMQ
jgi:hypothetical protein